MQTVDQVVNFARANLGTILPLSGEVLYSAASTLRPGEVYLLGHNPGGDDKDPTLPTVGRSLDELPTKTWNSYTDTSWNGYEVGEAPLQLRVKCLLERLEQRPNEVAASNLIFPRSRDAASSSFLDLSKTCWRVHEQILSIVNPRLIIAYGNSTYSPYQFLFDEFSANSQECYPSGHATWVCRSFVVPGRFRVVGVPHLSRYKISAHDDVADWIRGLSRPSRAA